MKYFYLLFTLALSTLAHGQEGRTIKCRFASLNSRVPVPDMLTMSVNNAEVPVSVPTSSISKPVACFTSTSTLSFISASDRTPLASATIPASVKNVILLFVQAPKTEGALPWRTFVIEDSDKNFPDGGAFVANFHNQDIRFIIGEHKVQLPPGKSNGVALPAQRDDFNMAAVAFQFQQASGWKGAAETLLRFLPGSRYLMITFVDPESGRPQVVTMRDTGAAEPLVKQR